MNSTIISEAISILKEQKEEGVKIVGVVQHGIFPDELVLAAGAFPLRLILGGKDEQEIGDQYLSATTCPFGRSLLGFLENQHPLYELIDVMIVGTFCNGVQNVANYLEKFEIPSVPLFVPHGNGTAAFNYYLNELIKIKEFLEKFSGNTVGFQDINSAIKKYNKMRSLLRKINDFRGQDNPPVRGMMIHQLVSQAHLLGPDVMVPELQGFLSKLEGNPLHFKGVRVFLTGSGITLGDSLIDAIEENCGGLIVADDLWSGSDYFLEDVDVSNPDPIIALAEKYLCKNMCGRMLPDTRTPKILELYHKFRASGIINHTLKYCDSYSNLKPEFRRFMAKKNVPVLDLDRDYAESDFGQIQTRIEAFLEMID